MTRRVVMFSSGAGSWACARRIADTFGTAGLVLLFADVKGESSNPHDGEDADNYRFAAEAAADIGVELTTVSDGRTVWEVFHDDKFLGNTRLANCSKFLKQIPCRNWLEANCDPSDTIVYVGIDWTESYRVPAIVKGYAPFRAEAPLTEPPYLDKSDVLAALATCGIQPPRLYAAGYVHANCGGFCVRAGQGQFAHLLEENPERYAYHEAKEQELRAYLGKDVTILRDRRGGTTKPLTLRAFRERHEATPAETDRADIGGCGCFVAEETLDALDRVLLLLGVA